MNCGGLNHSLKFNKRSYPQSFNYLITVPLDGQQCVENLDGR